MRHFLSFVLLTVAFLHVSFLALAGQPAVAEKERAGFNSLCPTVHDPVMARGDDGRYYIFSTGMGLDMMSSADMVTWLKEPAPLFPYPQWPLEYVPSYRGHTWAPDIIRHNGLWYLYYSCSTFGKNISAIGVAVNNTLNPSSPEYRWIDKGLVIASAPGVNNWNAIDPNVVFDAGGSAWLTFGSFWDGIQLVRLGEDMKTPESAPTTIARRHKHLAGTTHIPVPNAIEAPFIVYNDGYYYLFVSHDYCCKGLKSNYKTVVGRSREIVGPYYDKNGCDMACGGGTLLVGDSVKYSGVGHCSVYKFDEKWYFVAHGYNRERKGASTLFIRRLMWIDGWPVIM